MAAPDWASWLKASGPQLFGVGAVCFVVWLASQNHLIELPLAVEVTVMSVGIVTIGLAMGSFLTSIARLLKRVYGLVERTVRQKKKKQTVNHQIQFLSDTEKEILGHMLHNNLKMVTTDQTGGRAVTLISKGFMMVAVRPGQVFSALDMPIGIPEDVWDVLITQR